MSAREERRASVTIERGMRGVFLDRGGFPGGFFNDNTLDFPS